VAVPIGIPVARGCAWHLLTDSATRPAEPWVILQHLLEFPAAALAETVVATLNQQIIGGESHLVPAIAPPARLLDPYHAAMNSKKREPANGRH